MVDDVHIPRMVIDNGFVAAHLADITVIIAWPESTINVCNVRKLNHSNFRCLGDFDVMPDTSENKKTVYFCIKYYYLGLIPVYTWHYGKYLPQKKHLYNGTEQKTNKQEEKKYYL